MEDERYQDLLANVKAIELIVRGLFTKWALEADDPKQSAFRMIGGLIGALPITKDAEFPEIAQALSRVEDHLRHFGEQVMERLPDRK